MRSSGARRRRRTREVLVRMDSTKQSMDPFTSGSLSGGEMDRFSSVAVMRVSTLSFPGKNRATQPLTRSKTTWSAVVRSSTAREYRHPLAMRS